MTVLVFLPRLGSHFNDRCQVEDGLRFLIPKELLNLIPQGEAGEGYELAETRDLLQFDQQ